jgi:hypothetical protein
MTDPQPTKEQIELVRKLVPEAVKSLRAEGIPCYIWENEKGEAIGVRILREGSDPKEFQDYLGQVAEE